jgi:hypothetical protein
VKHRAATLIGVLSTLTHPLKCVALRIVHRASVIQTIKQTGQLFRKKYTEDVTVVQQSTRVADSSMRIASSTQCSIEKKPINGVKDWRQPEAGQDNSIHEASL